jgi:predicted kinase
MLVLTNNSSYVVDFPLYKSRKERRLTKGESVIINVDEQRKLNYYKQIAKAHRLTLTYIPDEVTEEAPVATEEILEEEVPVATVVVEEEVLEKVSETEVNETVIEEKEPVTEEVPEVKAPARKTSGRKSRK